MKDARLRDIIKELADANIDIDEFAEMLEEEYDKREAEGLRKEEIAAAANDLVDAILWYYECIFETQVSDNDEEYLRKRLNGITAEMLKIKTELDKAEQTPKKDAPKKDAEDAFQNWFREMGLN